MSSSRNNSERILQISPHIDLNKIKKTVTSLKVHKDVVMTDLKGESAEQWKSIAETADLLYGTKYYKDFVKTIQDAFSDVNSYIPNTVGAYLNGCNVKPNKDFDIGCSAICAGSIPSYQKAEKRDSWTFSDSKSALPSMNSAAKCDQLVLLAVWDSKDKRFTFTDLNTGDNAKYTYIYTSISSASAFPGFSADEKKALEDHGVSKVNLMYYDSTGFNYTELLGGFVKLCDVTVRDSSANGPNAPNVVNPNQNQSEQSSNSVFWFIVIVLVILIILALIYSYSK